MIQHKKTFFFAISLALLAICFLLVSQGTAEFQALEKKDPLFHFGTVSSEELRKIANELEKINKTYKENEFLSGSLYPAALWFAFAKVAERREKYIRNPNFLNTFFLAIAEKQAAEQYDDSIQRYSLALEKIVKESPLSIAKYRMIVLPGIESDLNLFRGAIASISRNAEILKELASNRFFCLFTGSCGAIPNTFPEPALRPLNEEIPKLLPHSFFEKIRETAYAEKLSDKYFGTISDCFGNNYAWFSLWERNYSETTKGFFPKLATNTFYRKLNKDHYFPQDKVALEKNLAYTWQPETNVYLCPDLRYYPALMSMLAIINTVENSPFAPHLMSAPEKKQQLQEIEEILLRSKFISEDLIQNYVDALKEAKSDFTAIERVRADDIILAWKTKSGELFKIFESFRIDAERFAIVMKELTTKLLPIALPFSHSNISIAFATWNMSIWKIHDFQIVRGADNTGDTIIDYWGLLQKNYSEKELIEIHAATVEGSKKIFFK